MWADRGGAIAVCQPGPGMLPAPGNLWSWVQKSWLADAALDQVHRQFGWLNNVTVHRCRPNAQQSRTQFLLLAVRVIV